MLGQFDVFKAWALKTDGCTTVDSGDTRYKTTVGTDTLFASRTISGAKYRVCYSCEWGSENGSGGIAQLVEHVLCKHEVTGSNPVASTRLRPELGVGRSLSRRS